MNTGRTHFKTGVAPWNKGVLVQKVCENCKKGYEVHPYRKATSKVCSKKCYIVRECFKCKKKFNGRIGQKFCTFACSVENKKGKMPKNFGNQFLVHGKDNANWKGGITPETIMVRTSNEYRLWREAVFARDNWTCQECNARGCELNADHIKPFALFPELRVAIDNGRTLCVPCHRKTPTYGNRVKSKNTIT